MLHVIFWRRRNYAYKIISLLFFVWTRGKLLFCFVFFPCCYKPALLEGALLHFIPPTTTNNQQSLSPPPLSLQAASRAIGPRPVQPFSHRDGLGRPKGPERNLPGPELWSATGWDKEQGCNLTLSLTQWKQGWERW